MARSSRFGSNGSFSAATRHRMKRPLSPRANRPFGGRPAGRASLTQQDAHEWAHAVRDGEVEPVVPVGVADGGTALRRGRFRAVDVDYVGHRGHAQFLRHGRRRVDRD